ncbi:MAG TPA: protein kinase [Polyangiaceae bacterium]|nr:protein kinase [Polyangiaceae bacterium]
MAPAALATGTLTAIRPPPAPSLEVTSAPRAVPEQPEAAGAHAGASSEEASFLIGQYEVIRELGRGGMGVVYLARDVRLGRKVAIKLLQSRRPDFTARFITEARATARCSHENIVVIHEVGEFRGSPFMVLEFLEGQTLSTFLKRFGPLPASRAAELMASVVRALVCAHSHGIVHRDLKPENIFITDSGTVKVLDFGIAKVLGVQPSAAALPIYQSMTSTDRSGIAGTLAYMSPEQWGVSEIDHRTDIWAAGIVLFEMLTGVHPLVLVGKNPQHWVPQLDQAMPSVLEHAPNTPSEFATLVGQCLRKLKVERVPDAVSLLKALEPFLPGRASLGPIPIESGPYTGLRSFQEEDAGRFFGRDREIAAMAARVREFPLLAVVGPSGVGKSSFVRAGIVPALKHSGENWSVAVTRPGREPLLALAALISPLIASSPTLVDDLGVQREIAQRLLHEPGYFGSALRASARRNGQKLLLFVDQFEELYTLGAELRDRLAFTACLAGAADDVMSPVRVVASIRSDFLDRVAEDPHFVNELSKGLFFLGPPSNQGLREALVRPAELAGYRFESPAMVDEMVQHLEAVPGALPLLQFTAAQLWERRDVVRRQLTEESYQRIGGIAGALVSHADGVVEKLGAELQVLCRTLFVNLVTIERTRAVRELRELREASGDPSELQRLLDHLVASRLLIVQALDHGTTVEIVHESLITSWPKLRRWLDESHEDTIFLNQLLSAARQWQVRHDSGLLWSGEMVEELARFQRRHPAPLPDFGAAFVKAVFDQYDRRRKRNRVLSVIAATLLAGLLAAAVVVLVIVRNAQTAAERNAATARKAELLAKQSAAAAKTAELGARSSAETARIAEAAAKQRLIDLERANRAREQSDQQRIEALTRENLTREELAKKNVMLQDALEHAERERLQARAAEEKARLAEAREAKRANDLERILGSSLVPELKE